MNVLGTWQNTTCYQEFLVNRVRVYNELLLYHLVDRNLSILATGQKQAKKYTTLLRVWSLKISSDAHLQGKTLRHRVSDVFSAHAYQTACVAFLSNRYLVPYHLFDSGAQTQKLQPKSFRKEGTFFYKWVRVPHYRSHIDRVQTKVEYRTPGPELGP